MTKPPTTKPKPTAARTRIPNKVLARPVPWTVERMPGVAAQLRAVIALSRPAAVAMATALAQFARDGSLPEGMELGKLRYAWKGSFRIKLLGVWRIVLRPVPEANKVIVVRLGLRRDAAGTSIYRHAPARGKPS